MNNNKELTINCESYEEFEYLITLQEQYRKEEIKAKRKAELENILHKVCNDIREEFGGDTLMSFFNDIECEYIDDDYKF